MVNASQLSLPASAASRGWTYLVLLWWVAISGVMLMALARHWSLQSQREREAELVFRGQQISAALQAYHDTTATQKVYPTNLEDLLQDQRAVTVKHHLRKAWPDPITGQDWGLLRDENQGIRGVFSTSGKAPLGGPPEAKSYADWVFTAAP
jgi:type II secretory pathway pseudopilin PulG